MRQSFDPKAGLIVVPARLRGPRGAVSIRLALDTGATTTLINWDIAVIAGYDPATIVERTQITTGSGVEFCPLLRVRNLEALGRRRKGFQGLMPYAPAKRQGGWIIRS